MWCVAPCVCVGALGRSLLQLCLSSWQCLMMAVLIAGTHKGAHCVHTCMPIAYGHDTSRRVSVADLLALTIPYSISCNSSRPQWCGRSFPG